MTVPTPLSTDRRVMKPELPPKDSSVEFWRDYYQQLSEYWRLNYELLLSSTSET